MHWYTEHCILTLQIRNLEFLLRLLICSLTGEVVRIILKDNFSFNNELVFWVILKFTLKLSNANKICCHSASQWASQKSLKTVQTLASNISLYCSYVVLLFIAQQTGLASLINKSDFSHFFFFEGEVINVIVKGKKKSQIHKHTTKIVNMKLA